MTLVDLGAVAQINPRWLRRPDDDESVSFLPMAELMSDGSTTRGRTRPFSDVAKGYTQFLDGDLLVAKITPCFQNNKIGLAALDHRFGVGSTEFHVIRPDSNHIDPRYLLNFLRRDEVRADGERQMTGSGGQRRVPAGFLEGLQVPLPPLSEQRRIATILDRATDLEAIASRAASTLEQAADMAFEDHLQGAGCNRDVTVSDIATVTGGKRLPKGAEYAPGPTGHPYIRVVDMRKGQIDGSSLKFLPDDIYERISRYVVAPRDVVISIAGSIGQVASVPPDLVGANLTENAARISPRRAGDYHPVWLAALLRSARMQDQIRSHVGQVTIGKLALFRIEKLSIPLVAMDHQLSLVQRLDKIMQMQAIAHSRETMLQRLSKSLRKQAFSGLL